MHRRAQPRCIGCDPYTNAWDSECPTHGAPTDAEMTEAYELERAAIGETLALLDESD